MSLPLPSANQAFCHVSALDSGIVDAPLAWVLDGVSDEDRYKVPVLAYLVRHHTNQDTFLFDLGLRKDWRTLPPLFVEYLTEKLHFEPHVPQDVVEALAKGGAKPSDINRVCISHLHFDHYGDSSLFPTSQFFVGEGGRGMAADAYPKNPSSGIPPNVIPEDRTTFLNPDSWPALGPFPHAHDFYDDGSLYIVDAGPGHIPGHVNFLIRTSADGGWIYLAGDSAHHWSLIKGEAKIGRHAVFGCAHLDPDASERHISRIRTLMEKNPRVRVLLAHDGPWYEENKNGSAFWPGTIESL